MDSREKDEQSTVPYPTPKGLEPMLSHRGLCFYFYESVSVVLDSLVQLLKHKLFLKCLEGTGASIFERRATCY